MNLRTIHILSIEPQVPTKGGEGAPVALSLCHPLDDPLIVILCIMPKIDCGIELGYHLLIPIMLEPHDVFDVPVLTHLSHLITSLIVQICHMSPIHPLIL